MLTKKDIKKATIECNTTAAAIAEKLGITPQNYNNLLDKNGRLNQNDLRRIAAALGVRYLSAFVDGNGDIIAGGISEPLTIPADKGTNE